jgi:hypothetical protein
LNRLIGPFRRIIAELHADDADPPLQWIDWEADEFFLRRIEQIYKFLLRVGPEFADLLDRFEKLTFSRPVTHREYPMGDETRPEKYHYQEIQIPALRRAVQILIEAGKRMRRQRPVSAHTSSKLPGPSERRTMGKRGPPPRNHAVIVEIVDAHRPWNIKLREICSELDFRGVSVFRIKDRTGNIPRKTQPKDWSEALRKNRRSVSDAIEHSLRQVGK